MVSLDKNKSIYLLSTKANKIVKEIRNFKDPQNDDDFCYFYKLPVNLKHGNLVLIRSFNGLSVFDVEQHINFKLVESCYELPSILTQIVHC